MSDWDADIQICRGLGLHPFEADGELQSALPPGTVAFRAQTPTALTQMMERLREIGVPPLLRLTKAEDVEIVVYGLGDGLTISSLQSFMGEDVDVLSEGTVIGLPTGEWLEASSFDVQHISDLPVIDSIDRFDEDGAAGGHKALSQFSLRGSGAELEAAAIAAVFIFGRCILAGQATALYAAPNTGKTLLLLHMLIMAVQAGVLNPNNVFYVNADDNSAGLAEKLLILDELGVHTLVPGFNNFKTSDLAASINVLVANDACDGVVVIIDTMKKFVDLMDKKGSAVFGNVMRQFVMKGGTVVALAHTRKNLSNTGGVVYGGTSDIVEDFDAAAFIVPINGNTVSDEKIVKFEWFKRRGGNMGETYAYAQEPGLSYSERLASVRLVHDDEVGEVMAHGEVQSDQPAIDAIVSALGDGIDQKMALVKAASSRSKLSRRAIMQVLERYTGNDPEKHRWTFAVRDRGAKVFALHQA